MARRVVDQDPTFWTAAEIRRSSVQLPSAVYLGGCRGAGFGTGVEWNGVASAMMLRGARTVVAHNWPIIDARSASAVDEACTAMLAGGGRAGERLAALQREWHRAWRDGDPDALAPHYWAGLVAIGQ